MSCINKHPEGAALPYAWSINNLIMFVYENIFGRAFNIKIWLIFKKPNK